MDQLSAFGGGIFGNKAVTLWPANQTLLPHENKLLSRYFIAFLLQCLVGPTTMATH
jgi:hypothetical protein